jgi:hypothetical protein
MALGGVVPITPDLVGGDQYFRQKVGITDQNPNAYSDFKQANPGQDVFSINREWQAMTPEQRAPYLPQQLSAEQQQTPPLTPSQPFNASVTGIDAQGMFFATPDLIQGPGQFVDNTPAPMPAPQPALNPMQVYLSNGQPGGRQTPTNLVGDAIKTPQPNPFVPLPDPAVQPPGVIARPIGNPRPVQQPAPNPFAKKAAPAPRAPAPRAPVRTPRRRSVQPPLMSKPTPVRR